jgi:hypothetical protein
MGKAGHAGLATVALSSSLVACFPDPATGVASNGGPLRMQYRSGTGTYVSQDKTGEDVHTYSDGSQSVTEHYSNVQHSYEWTDWKYFQGKTELDEEDYYRLANDADSARYIQSIRASAMRKMQIGLPLAIVGLVAASVLSSTGNSSTATAYGSIGASAVALTGVYVWYWGESDMTKRHHLSQDKANERADIVEECRDGHCISARGGRSASTP